MDANIGFNTMINDLSNKLVQDIKDSHLPVGIVYLVMKDMFSDIRKVYEETLRAEMAQAEETKEKVSETTEKKK